MKFKPLKKEKLYDIVADRIEELKDTDAGSEEAKELKYLTKLLKEFERKKLQAV